MYYLHRNGDVLKCSPGLAYISEDNASSLGNLSKSYKGTYRKLAGAACELWDSKKNKPIFITLTSKNIISHENGNKCLSNYLDNLKKNYSLNSYLWVAEFQQRSAVHYHAIFDIPYIPVNQLNIAWCTAIHDYSEFSANAVRFSPGWGGVVRSRSRAVRYICKYISKSSFRTSSKCYGASRKLIKKPLYLDRETFEDIMQNHWRFTKEYEYVTVYYTKSNVNLYDRVRRNTMKLYDEPALVL